MAYITESKLQSIFDLPIALPDTLLKQSGYVVVATVKLLASQRLSLRVLALHLVESSIDPAVVSASNKIIPNLGIAYVVLRKDYTSGVPGSTGALDYIYASDLGVVIRPGVPYASTAPGNYSIIVANNCQASSASPIPSSTSIDFNVVVTGQFRLELTSA